ncbi:MAG: REP-associated tyrosine transposase [Myxococcales bacterium]|nr:REP-associated tyrosine transposase [Myxococcales bacterium]
MNVRQQTWGVDPAIAKTRRARPVRSRRAGPRPGDSRARPPKLRVPLPAKGEQLTFADAKTRGGPRPGSGRKGGHRPKVRHRKRPAHHYDNPVHVTMRRAKGLPSFRVERLHNLLREAIRATRRDGFRIVHYSIQNDHLHMLVEADDALRLTNGMKSFAVRVAMLVNHRVMARRRGKVWGDSYHRRELTTPSEVRSCLVYVLNNHLKHGEWQVGLIDPCSSAPWFHGWMHRREPVPPEPDAGQRAWTWLLAKGWSTVGLGWLHVGEVPRALWH